MRLIVGGALVLLLALSAHAQPCPTSGSVVISSTCNLTSGNYYYTSLTVVTGGKMVLDTTSGGNVLLNSTSNIDVYPGGVITASNLGYPAGSGPAYGSAGGGGVYAGGGGYGGRGGASVSSSFTARGYGADPRRPVECGSGPGTTTGNVNTNRGGGAVHLVASSAWIMGRVEVDGGGNVFDGTPYSGGGAGGSIWLEAYSLKGNGTLSAIGARSQTDSGGCGAGGRIAVYYTTVQWAGAAHVYSNCTVNSRRGGPGTVYVEDAGRGLREVIVDAENFISSNADVSAEWAGTSVSGTNYNLTNLNMTRQARLTLTDPTDTLTLADHPAQAGDGTATLITRGTVDARGVTRLANIGVSVESTGVLVTGNMINTTVTLRMNGTWQGSASTTLVVETGVVLFNVAGQSSGNSAGAYTFASLIVNGPGRVKVDNNGTASLTLRTAGDLWIKGAIDADGTGYPSTKGPGSSKQYSAVNGVAGGSYGGQGGIPKSLLWANVSAPYGADNTRPTELGSGGGFCGASDSSSAGGGSIHLFVGGNMYHNGTISASSPRALNIGCQGAGGSGGSLWIEVTGSLRGAGTIAANGGDTAIGAYNSGCGAGGRIAMWYDFSQATTWNGDVQAYSVCQGFGSRGGPGTIFLINTAAGVTMLRVDDRGLSTFQYLNGVPGSSQCWVTGTGSPWGLDKIQLDNTASVVFSTPTDSLLLFATTLIAANPSINTIYTAGSLSIQFTGLLDKMSLVGLAGSTMNLAASLTIKGTTIGTYGSLSGPTDIIVISGNNNTGGQLLLGASGNTLASPTATYVLSTLTILRGASAVLAGDPLAQRGVSLNLTNLTIAANASFNADGVGFYSGTGPGAGKSGGGGYGSGGGGYGGQGGVGTSGTNINDLSFLLNNPSYGADITMPSELGSGGGGQSNNGGSGAGGGHISLMVSGLLVLNGTISSNGGTCNQPLFGPLGGGGSGGSLHLILANTFVDTTAMITANGGGACGSSGGCGGGGRIAIYFFGTTNLPNSAFLSLRPIYSQITAFGDACTVGRSGGAGSIYLYANLAGYNGARVANSRPDPTAVYQDPSRAYFPYYTRMQVPAPSFNWDSSIFEVLSQGNAWFANPNDTVTIHASSFVTDTSASILVAGTLVYSTTGSMVNTTIGLLPGSSTSLPSSLNMLNSQLNMIGNAFTPPVDTVVGAGSAIHIINGAAGGTNPSLVLGTYSFSTVLLQDGGQFPSCGFANLAYSDVILKFGTLNVDALSAVHSDRCGDRCNGAKYFTPPTSSGYGPGGGASSAGSGIGAFPTPSTVWFPFGGYGEYFYAPREIGAAGALNLACPYSYCGEGGGVLHVIATTLINNGRISANGGNGSCDTVTVACNVGGAGGGGGSLFIEAGTLSGSGAFQVNGGAGCGPYPGCGAGGKLALYYTTSSFTGSNTSISMCDYNNRTSAPGIVFLADRTTGRNITRVSGNTNILARNFGLSTYFNGGGSATTYRLDTVIIETGGRVVVSGSCQNVYVGAGGMRGDTTGLFVTSTQLEYANPFLNSVNIVINPSPASLKTLADFTLFNAVVQILGTLVPPSPAGVNVTIYGDATKGGQLTLGATGNTPGTPVGSGQYVLKSLQVNDYGILAATINNNLGSNVTVLQNMIVTPLGSVDVSGRGNQQAAGPFAGRPASQYIQASGGGHAGLGGQARNQTVLPPNSLGANYQQPIDIGSGGGACANSTGGRAGGAIYIKVRGTLTMNGLMTADGTRGNGCAGGGAGGSLWVDTYLLYGSGSFTANGGGASQSGVGCGSGGRLAVYAAQTPIPNGMTFSAYSNCSQPGAISGAAGTIYTQDCGGPTNARLLINNTQLSLEQTGINLPLTGQQTFRMIIQRAVAAFNGTFSVRWNDGYYSSDAVSLVHAPHVDIDLSSTTLFKGNLFMEQGASLIVPSLFTMQDSVISFVNVAYIKSPVYCGSLRMKTPSAGYDTRMEFGNSAQSSSLVTNQLCWSDAVLEPGTSMRTGDAIYAQFVIQLIFGNLDLQSGASINADGNGGANTCGAWDGVGGSYGGLGGKPNSTINASPTIGAVSGDANCPSSTGFCGGQYFGPGQNGLPGGIVRIAVVWNATINGRISSDAYNSTGTRGGASGGSVWLDINSLAGNTGFISASGALPGDPLFGCGGGGRVAVYYATSSFNTSSMAARGLNYSLVAPAANCPVARRGGAGSVVYRQRPLNFTVGQCSPLIIPHSIITVQSMQTLNARNISCMPGYNRVGSPFTACPQWSSTWTPTPPVCNPVNCGNPGTPGNGSRTGSTFTYPNSVVFTCNTNFILLGNDTISCNTSGQWNGPLPTCVLNGTYIPPNCTQPYIDYGAVVFTPPPAYNQGVLECTTQDYVPDLSTGGVVGPVDCVNGVWLGVFANCTSFDCGAPPVANMQGYIGSTLFGGSVTVSCPVGYTASGPMTISCPGAGGWSALPALPQCLAPPPPVAAPPPPPPHAPPPQAPPPVFPPPPVLNPPFLDAVTPLTLALAGGQVTVHGGYWILPLQSVVVDGVDVTPSNVSVAGSSSTGGRALLQSMAPSQSMTITIPPHTASSYVSISLTDGGGRVATLANQLYATDDCPLPGQYGVNPNCKPCPEGAVCPGGNRLWPEEGYWNSGEESGFVKPCPDPPSRCQAGRQGTCSSGYAGYTCTDCAPGYFLSQGECVACGPTSDLTLLFLINGLLFLALDVCICVLPDGRLTHVIAFIQFLQLLRAAGKNAPTRLPDFVKAIYDYLAIISFDVDFLRPSCATEPGFSAVFWGNMAIIACLLFPPLIGLAVLWLIRKPHRVFYQNRMVRTVTIVVSLAYYIMCVRTIESVNCAKGADGNYLVADSGTACYRGQSVGFQVLGWVGLICVCAFPFTLGLFLFILHRRGLLTNVVWVSRFGNFYESLKDKVAFLFGVVPFFHLLLIALFSSTMRTTSLTLARYVLSALSFLFVVVTIALMRPYKTRASTLAALAGYTAGFLSIFLSFVSLRSLGLTQTGIIVIVSLVIAAFLIVWAIILVRESRRPKTHAVVPMEKAASYVQQKLPEEGGLLSLSGAASSSFKDSFKDSFDDEFKKEPMKDADKPSPLLPIVAPNLGSISALNTIGDDTSHGDNSSEPHSDRRRRDDSDSKEKDDDEDEAAILGVVTRGEASLRDAATRAENAAALAASAEAEARSEADRAADHRADAARIKDSTVEAADETEAHARRGEAEEAINAAEEAASLAASGGLKRSLSQTSVGAAAKAAIAASQAADSAQAACNDAESIASGLPRATPTTRALTQQARDAATAAERSLKATRQHAARAADAASAIDADAKDASAAAQRAQRAAETARLLARVAAALRELQMSEEEQAAILDKFRPRALVPGGEADLLRLEAVVAAIQTRERNLLQLADFEWRASDGARLFKGSSVERLKEEKARQSLTRDLDRESTTTVHLRTLLKEFFESFGVAITLKGRDYNEKMEQDVVEMLYALEERRKAEGSAGARAVSAKNSPKLPRLNDK